METSRLTKKVFLISFQQNARCRNWAYRVSENLKKINCDEYINVDQGISKHKISEDVKSRLIHCDEYINVDQGISKRKISEDVKSRLMHNYIDDWKTKINREYGTRRNIGNKLRKYKLLKNDYTTEHYCRILMPQSHRSAFAKFRTGVAPLRIEMGRYEGLHQSQRVCPFCPDFVEDEYHVIFDCNLYNELRQRAISECIDQ